MGEHLMDLTTPMDGQHSRSKEPKSFQDILFVADILYLVLSACAHRLEFHQRFTDG